MSQILLGTDFLWSWKKGLQIRKSRIPGRFMPCLGDCRKRLIFPLAAKQLLMCSNLGKMLHCHLERDYNSPIAIFWGHQIGELCSKMLSYKSKATCPKP